MPAPPREARLTEKVDQLESALERRAVIERAKGILMERHAVDERDAFELLRDHARAHSARVVDVAHAVPTATRCCPAAPAGKTRQWAVPTQCRRDAEAGAQGLPEAPDRPTSRRR